MRIPMLVFLITASILALLSPAVMATDLKIDDSVNPEWMAMEGEWRTGTSSSSKYGSEYYYCNQSPGNGNSVTFTPVIPDVGDGVLWEVYIWYSAGGDRTSQAEVTVHHDGTDTVYLINQQQNGGMWVYLGTWAMTPGTSSYVRIANNGLDIGKIVVADAVRFYAQGGDRTPPNISNIASIPGSNSAVITWDTDEPATSQVEYGPTISYGSSTVRDNALVTSHSVSILNLEPEEHYHFRVKSEDGAGNLAISNDQQFTTGSSDTFPPIISEIEIVEGANSAVVMWLTDEPADSQVEYGLTTSYGSSTDLDSRLVTSHRVVIRDLTPSTNYHFKIRSADGALNVAVSDDQPFRTTPADTTPPVISDIAAYPDSYGAMITWTTNEYATSQVDYGLTASYGSSTTLDLDLVVKHSVGIANLLPQKLYHYRVRSTDGSGIPAWSADHTFTTKAEDKTPPDIWNVRSATESRSCVITWLTDELATSQVRYGTSEPPTIATTEDTTLVTSHSVTLTDLLPNTKYYYEVVSCDAYSNCNPMGTYSFTTKALDVTPPMISDVAAEPASNSAIITWVTDEPATSQVGYGEEGYTSLTPLDAGLVTDHRVSITGLTPNTTYVYCVVSEDAEGNEGIMTGFTFTTGDPDETPPVISEISVARNVNSAIVRWRTNEPATSQVEYGLTAAYGNETTLDTNLVKFHSVRLEGLEANTLYHFRVKSTDGAGNTAVSEDRTFETSSTPPEYRMIWADSWHNGFLTPTETTSFIDTVAAANYNAIVVEVRKAGDAYYLSDYEPWATNVDTGYDPLQDLIDKAHASGIEVHAWIVTYRAWFKTFPAAPEGHVYDVHGPESAEDWSMRTSDGGYEEGNSLNIDPGVPGVQDYLANIVRDIVSKYNVDGINFDYIRYPSSGCWGYNDYTKQRFYYEYGYYPPTSPLDGDGNPDPRWGVWCDYRRRQVTDLVRKCFVEAMYINPRIKMSVDTVGWEGADPNTNYPGTPQYAGVFQDARGWMREHIVDLNILMNYKREYNTVQKDSYRRWADWLPREANASGRLAIDGQGVYLNSIAGSVAQMLYSRNAGSDGLCNYSYAVTNKDTQPASDFFNSVRTNLYSAPAPIPDMPWKNQPTRGIIFGTISDAAHPNDSIYRDWVYQAEVTLTSPALGSPGIITTYTDATGTYAFLDLPPGVYTIRISKSGYDPKALGGVDLSAGDVLRKDAAIQSGMYTSPPGTVTAGWSLISLPVQPADVNPLTVFQGIDIEARLYRWDNAGQSIIIYSNWSPLQFGDINIDDGYWLQTTGPAIISYEPAEVVQQDQRTIAIPKAGWSIIGCPFEGPKDWNAVTVTYGGYTRPMATARDWAWLESLGYWWDNSVPGGGLRTYGLDDDWAEETVLRPWKGYWLQTHLNNLSITFH